MRRVSGLCRVTQPGRGRGSVGPSPRSNPVHLTHQMIASPLRFLNTECWVHPKDPTGGRGWGPRSSVSDQLPVMPCCWSEDQF